MNLEIIKALSCLYVLANIPLGILFGFVLIFNLPNSYNPFVDRKDWKMYHLLAFKAYCVIFFPLVSLAYLILFLFKLVDFILENTWYKLYHDGKGYEPSKLYKWLHSKAY